MPLKAIDLRVRHKHLTLTDNDDQSMYNWRSPSDGEQRRSGVKLPV